MEWEWPLVVQFERHCTHNNAFSMEFCIQNSIMNGTFAVQNCEWCILNGILNRKMWSNKQKKIGMALMQFELLNGTFAIQNAIKKA